MSKRRNKYGKILWFPGRPNGCNVTPQGRNCRDKLASTLCGHCKYSELNHLEVISAADQMQKELESEKRRNAIREAFENYYFL